MYANNVCMRAWACEFVGYNAVYIFVQNTRRYYEHFT